MARTFQSRPAALNGLTLVGAKFNADVKRALLAFTRWVHERMPTDSRPTWDFADRDFILYVGRHYRDADGITHAPLGRNKRFTDCGKAFKIAIHLHQGTFCDAFRLVDTLVHELRHAADYEWECQLQFRMGPTQAAHYAKRKGMIRGGTTAEGNARRAEARAEHAVTAFRQTVGHKEILAAFRAHFTEEQQEHLCPQRVRFWAAMRRVGR